MGEGNGGAGSRAGKNLIYSKGKSQKRMPKKGCQK